MITGVRSYDYSIQKYFSVYSDITTLGKIIGGGLPIGIIGLSKKISQQISNKRIFFGGTFSGNSLSAFVGNEVFNYISKNKKFISTLNEKSKYFQDKMNQFFKKENLNLKIYRFASILRIIFTDNKIYDRQQRDFFENNKKKKINLFRKFLLKEKNILCIKWYNFFFSGYNIKKY